jgi:hypothetical protein
MPRALLPKGQPEWCYRTIDKLKLDLENIRITGVDYDKTLAQLDEYRAWDVVPVGKPYGTREAMLVRADLLPDLDDLAERLAYRLGKGLLPDLIERLSRHLEE